MKNIIVFLVIVCSFAPQVSLSDTKRLAIDDISLSSDSKLNSDVVTNEFRNIAKENPGEYQIVLATKAILNMAERIKVHGKVLDNITLPNPSDPDKIEADFLLCSGLMQEENGQFTVVATMYNLASQSEEFFVKQSGYNREQALSRLWRAIGLYPKELPPLYKYQGIEYPQ